MKKLLLFIPVFLLSFLVVRADPASDKANQIQELEKKVAALKDQAKTLTSQIAAFDAQIKLATLKISQTEDQIASLSTKITTLESKLQERSKLLERQIVQTYKKGPLDPVALLFSAGDFSEVVSRFKYLQIVQATNRKFLYETQKVQANYAQQKDLVQESRKKLQVQKAALDSLRAERDNLLRQTKSSEANYQKLLAQAKAQLAAMRNFVSGKATILNNQTFCDGWGCYYNQRDSQWGNIGLGGSNLSTAEYGCLVSASAMIATHYSKTLKPLDIAVTPGAFFSPDKNTALLWDTVTVNGITVRRIKYQSRSVIDSELAAGRPVIVGLYSGPAHFIVLKSGSNGNYIMNDPFMENGHDVNFSSKYALSDITDVERVVIE